MESKTVGRVPNRAAVGWKSPNNSISSNSSSSTSDEASTFSTLPNLKSVKSPSTKPMNNPIQMNHQQNFHTIAHHQVSKNSQFHIIEPTQQKFQKDNDVNVSCKKSPMLRRMKLALAEAENKNQMHSFKSTNQNDSSTVEKARYQIPVNHASFNTDLKKTNSTIQVSTNHKSTNHMSNNERSTNEKSTNEKSTYQNSWQNSTKKGTVKADEDFEFQGFPKPPPQFFPPPPNLNSNISQTVPVQITTSGPSLNTTNNAPIEIKRIPLVFKG
jgi:hypothetical protein